MDGKRCPKAQSVLRYPHTLLYLQTLSVLSCSVPSLPTPPNDGLALYPSGYQATTQRRFCASPLAEITCGLQGDPVTKQTVTGCRLPAGYPRCLTSNSVGHPVYALPEVVCSWCVNVPYNLAHVDAAAARQSVGRVTLFFLPFAIRLPLAYFPPSLTHSLNTSVVRSVHGVGDGDLTASQPAR